MKKGTKTIVAATILSICTMLLASCGLQEPENPAASAQITPAPVESGSLNAPPVPEAGSGLEAPTAASNQSETTQNEEAAKKKLAKEQAAKKAAKQKAAAQQKAAEEQWAAEQLWAQQQWEAQQAAEQQWAQQQWEAQQQWAAQQQQQGAGCVNDPSLVITY